MKMPGTKYDKFYVESLLPRCRTVDRLEPLMTFLEASDYSTGVECGEAFVNFIDDYLNAGEQQ